MKVCEPLIKMLPINLRISPCLPLRECSSGPVRFAKPKLLPNVEGSPSFEVFEKIALDAFFADGAFGPRGGFAEVRDVGFIEQ